MPEKEKTNPYGHWLEKYYDIRRAARLSENTLDREREAHKSFRQYLDSIRFTGTELDVTKEIIHDYAEYLFTRTDLMKNTCRNKLYKLTHFYTEAVKQEWILKSPLLGFKLPKLEINPTTILTLKQIKALMDLPDLTTAKGIRDRTLFELFYSSAFRLSEVTTLTRDHFSEDYRRVRIRGKGEKEAVLPVGRMAAHFTRFYTEKIWPELNRLKGEQLFISVTSGTPMTRHVVYNTIREYLKKIVPNKNIGTHVFRYSIATHLADEGVDIRLIQEFMRHDKISTTARYIKQSFQQLQDVHRDTHPRN